MQTNIISEIPNSESTFSLGHEIECDVSGGWALAFISEGKEILKRCKSNTSFCIQDLGVTHKLAKPHLSQAVGFQDHTATPIQMIMNSLFPVPSQCLQTARGTFKLTLLEGEPGSRFDLLHSAGDRLVMPQQMWGSQLSISDTLNTHRISFPSSHTSSHRWSRT